MTSAEPRDLTRVADALADCARRLGANTGDEPPPVEIERVRRVLLRTAADLTGHARTLRRLDDEIELAERRHADGRDVAELRRRRTQAVHTAGRRIDDATRALVPGGDALDPATILRRLGGPAAAQPRSYFGRPAVDRGERVRRLTALLLRGTPHPGPVGLTHHPAVVTVPSRAGRLARIRRRLTSRTPARPTLGERA